MSEVSAARSTMRLTALSTTKITAADDVYP
jgi:hypothetical protein